MKFKLFDINVSVSYSTVFLITFSLVTAGVGQSEVFLCLLGASLHEFGHLICIYKYAGKPNYIAVGLFEMQICADLKFLSKGRETVITSAGIISNLIFCIIGFFFNSLFPNDLFFDFAMCNLFVGGLNLLPASSFDGGQLVFLLLSERIGEKNTEMAVLVLTIIIMFPLAIFGVFVLFTSRHNFSLLFVFLYLLSIFISKELR